MKDFPIFTTEYGVASLILREIPYRGDAYIRIRDTQPGMLEPMLKECVDFCRMAGARRILAAGHKELERCPLHCAVLQMRGTVEQNVEMVEHLFPVTEETVSQWRGIMNERMRNVDNAATLDSRDEKRILESGGAYFVHRGGTLLGVGWIEDGAILAVASVKPGSGERVLHTLMTLARGDSITLEVASTNEPALRLYERLGFLKTAEISRWYRVG